MERKSKEELAAILFEFEEHVALMGKAVSNFDYKEVNLAEANCLNRIWSLLSQLDDALIQFDKTVKV